MATPDRKTEIRKHAAEVFARSGFDRASIRDVAKAAEMSLAGLYYYYRSKDEILFDIQREAFETLLDRHSEALAGVKDPEEKLSRLVLVHISFFANNISEMKVMSRESETLSGELAEKINELKRRYVRLFRGVLEEMKRRAGLGPVSLGVSVFLLFGMMNWMYTWYDPERDGGAEEVAQAVKEVFLRGILSPNSH